MPTNQKEHVSTKMRHKQKQIMTASLMRKLSTKDKKHLKVLVLGAKSVGKSALTVRIKTRKFIHTYAPNIETRCTFLTSCDGESLHMEIIDSPALQTEEGACLEEKIKWADAFILMYSVTDPASLSALPATKCLINLYAKRRRKSLNCLQSDLLVALVGNKSDLEHERTVSEDMGRQFAEDHECTHFFEISTRESYDSVKSVFDSLYKVHKTHSPRLLRRKMSQEKSREKQTKTSEEDRIDNYRQKGRSRTTFSFLVDPPDSETQVSPIILRKVYEPTSPDGSSCCDENDRTHFVGEELVYEDTMSLGPNRRITLHTSPSITRRSRPLSRRQHSVDDNPNMISMPDVKHELPVM